MYKKYQVQEVPCDIPGAIVAPSYWQDVEADDFETAAEVFCYLLDEYYIRKSGGVLVDVRCGAEQKRFQVKVDWEPCYFVNEVELDG